MSGAPIFRPRAKALATHVRSLWGGAPETEDDCGRSAIRAGLLVVILFFGLFGGWAACAPLAAGVTAPAVVVVSGNRQSVQHRDGGVVSKLLVKEGDRVAKDQVLIELASAELSSIYDALLGETLELEATRARLSAEAARQDAIAPPASWARLTEEERARADVALERQAAEMRIRRQSLGAQSAILRQREAQSRARIQGYNDQIASVAEQSRLIEEELRGLRQLSEKGLVPLTRIRALERTKAELVGRRSDLSALIEQTRQGIGESSMQNIALREGRMEDVAEQMRTIDTRLNEVRPRLETTRAELERTRIRAPVDGAVVGLNVFTVGGVVRPGDKLMDVVPEAQPLVVDARVRPEDADDIRIGMKTEVRFTAFSDRSIPLVEGVVTKISADRFVEEQTGSAYFLAEVVVPREQLARVANTRIGGAALKAGLPAEVVIPLRARTALQYLVEPLDHALWRSFREH